MNAPEAQRDEAEAVRLANRIAELVDAQPLSPEIKLLALAKVTGHAATMAPEGEAAEVLGRVFARARRQMQISLLAARLRASGLGALMPVARV